MVKPTPLFSELRQRAEVMFQQETGSVLSPLSIDETQQALYELRVHQFELEMQNEELRIAHEQLEISRNHYFELYDLAPVGYLTLNNKGLIQNVNFTAATLFGIVHNGLLNRPLTDFLFSEDQDTYYMHNKRRVESGTKCSCELRLVQGEAEPLWVNLQSLVTRTGECWVTLNDISDRKKLEQEKLMLEQQYQLAQKLECLGVLVGGIAHDFNNILTIIIGYCSLARNKPETAGNYVVPIENAAKRAADLCRQMRVYGGKAPLAKSHVNMSELVGEIVEMVKSTTNRHVLIESILPPDIPAITADASQLRQVIMNLIINASEAIGEVAGVIRVSLSQSCLKDGSGEIDHLGAVIPPGLYACLEMSDTGCGMNEGTLRRIFEPFFSTKFAGRGLGLSATLGIINAHKGFLQISTLPGHGTTFKIFLPLTVKEANCAVSAQPITRSDDWRGSGVVLLVDDEDAIRFIARSMLETLGFSVVEAAHGQEAKNLYQQDPEYFDLVLTDVDMPVMDGFELFSLIKKNSPGLPVIFSSGYGDDVAERLADGKLAGLLNKPYCIEQMRTVIKGAMERH